MKFTDIMLIESDEDDQELFCLILNDVAPQAHCITFTYAKEALDYLKETNKLPQAIFINLYLPAMSGTDFLTAVKANKKLSTIPVYVYSTFTGSEMADVLKLGAAGFIPKTGSYSEVEDAFRNVFSA